MEIIYFGNPANLIEILIENRNLVKNKIFRLKSKLGQKSKFGEK